MGMLFKAIEQTKSDDPVKIAAALEGMKYSNFSANEAGFIRSDDHQFFEPLYISSFGPLGSTEPFDEEHTGWGWRLAAQIPVNDTIVTTTCKMNRPS
jgi:branched-chain amino acid transport system substrate-binding protein